MAEGVAPAAGPMASNRPLLTARFGVSVSGVELGWFQSVSGLGFEVTVEKVPEGGENYSEHHLPGRIAWQNIVLRNGWVDATHLMDWVLATSDAAGAGWRAGLPTYDLGVTLLDELGEPVRTWSFMRAFPVVWRGPELSTAADEIATEQLEIAHHGLGPAA